MTVKTMEAAQPITPKNDCSWIYSGQPAIGACVSFDRPGVLRDTYGIYGTICEKERQLADRTSSCMV